MLLLTNFHVLAVVNLTLIDLPGLTKVAVGKALLVIYFLSLEFPWFFIFLGFLLAIFFFRGAAWQYSSRHWKHGSIICWKGNEETNLYPVNHDSWFIFHLPCWSRFLWIVWLFKPLESWYNIELQLDTIFTSRNLIIVHIFIYMTFATNIHALWRSKICSLI